MRELPLLTNNKEVNTQKISEISVYCDGGSRGNPGPSACAFVVKNNLDKIIYSEGKFLGFSTNNIAEYQGVLLALNYLKNNYYLYKNYNYIAFYLDSKLIVNQLNGVYKIKDSHLKELCLQIKILENELKIAIKYHHIPREKNNDADLLVNKTFDTNH